MLRFLSALIVSFLLVGLSLVVLDLPLEHQLPRGPNPNSARDTWPQKTAALVLEPGEYIVRAATRGMLTSTTFWYAALLDVILYGIAFSVIATMLAAPRRSA